MDFVSLFNSIDWNYVFGILIVLGATAYKIWGVPYLKSKGIDQKYFQLFEQALLICGMMFRSDKVRQIITISLEIVCALENTGLSNDEKHTEAVKTLAERLLAKLDVTLDDNTLNVIVRLAVALMGDKK
jgi:hypothetical protein